MRPYSLGDHGLMCLAGSFRAGTQLSTNMPRHTVIVRTYCTNPLHTFSYTDFRIGCMDLTGLDGSFYDVHEENWVQHS